MASFATKTKISTRAAITITALERTAVSSSISPTRRLLFSNRRSFGGRSKFPPGPDLLGVNRLELRQAEILHRIGFIDKDGESIHGHWDLDRILPELLFDLRSLLGVERSGGLTDIGGGVDQGGNTGARSPTGDLHDYSGVFSHIVLGPTLAEDDHGVG